LETARLAHAVRRSEVASRSAKAVLFAGCHGAVGMGFGQRTEGQQDALQQLLVQAAIPASSATSASAASYSHAHSTSIFWWVLRPGCATTSSAD